MYRILKQTQNGIKDYGIVPGDSFKEACEFLVYQWGIECDGFYNKDENSFYGDKFIDGEKYYRNKMSELPDKMINFFIENFVLKEASLENTFDVIKTTWLESRMNTLDDIGTEFFDRIPYHYIHEIGEINKELDERYSK